MKMWFLRAVIFALFISTCACDQNTGTGTVSPPESGGVLSIQVEAVLPVPPPEPRVYPLPMYIKGMELSAPMAEALVAYDPEFQKWSLADYPPEKLKHYPYSAKSLPYAVLGDYNDDGIEDIVLAGHNKNASIVVALMSAATGYHAAEVQKASYYSRLREQGKEIPYTANEILLFQRKGCRYVNYVYKGDTDTENVVQKNDGFVLENLKWFNYPTSKFTRSGASTAYEWDSSASQFHSEPLDSSHEKSVIKCTLRNDFKKVVFEEKTRRSSVKGVWVRGASVSIAVKSASGEWSEQKPVRINSNTVYYTLPAGTEIKIIYSCTNPIEKYWQVSVAHWTSPPLDLKTTDGGDIPFPVISRVLPIRTSFGYYWITPDSAAEIKKDAVFSYACWDSKITTVITVKHP